MPVQTETSLSGPYIPNGVTTAFAFDFKATAANEVIAVDQDGVTISTALYSVALDEDEGGTLTFSVAPQLSDYSAIFVVGDPALTQPSDFDNAGPSFNPAALTRALDRATARDLKQQRQIDSSLKLSFGETAPILPPAAQRVSMGGQPRIMGFDRTTGELSVLEGADFRGGTGLAANTFSNLIDFKAAPTSQFKVANLSGVPGVADGQFFFETVNAPYIADPQNTFKADDTPLSTGAWVRQGADKVAFKAEGDARVVSIGERVSGLPVSVEQYHKPSDGTDYAPALARALAASSRVFFPPIAGTYRFESEQTITLADDTIVDFNGQRIESEDGTINFKGALIASSRSITANAARYATAVTLNSVTSIQPGDLLLIVTSQLPSSDWSDNKQDCVRIRSIAGNVLTLDEGLKFSYATSDPGLDVLIFRPRKLTLIRPTVDLIAADEVVPSGTTRKAFYCEGLWGITVTEPVFRGQAPFTRETNIYRNGIQFYYCGNVSIQSPTYERMSYGAGAYGATRNIVETNVTARFCRHSHLDMGGWASGYSLNGLVSSDSYQGISTHVCFDAHAENFQVFNDNGLSNWRCCGGSLRNGYIQSTVDDTAEAAQFQNTTPASGYEYINEDADFYISDVEFDTPNRINTVPYNVKFGRSHHMEGVKSPSVASGAGGSVGLSTFGPGNRIGSGARPMPPSNLIASPATRTYLPPRLDAYVADSRYHIDPRLQMVDQSEKKLRCYGSIIRKYAGGTFGNRLHLNAFAGIDTVFAVGKLTIRAIVQHQSSGLFSAIEHDYDFAVYFGGGAFMEFPTTPTAVRGPTSGAGGSNIVLALTSPTLGYSSPSADNYIDFGLGLSVSGVSSPSYGASYELLLEETFS